MNCFPRPYAGAASIAAARVRPSYVWPLLVVCLLFASVGVAAQTAPGTEGTSLRGLISGRVFDATSGKPLALAQVYLETIEGAGAGLRASPGAISPVRASRIFMTDADGAYAFLRVAPGTYRIHVQRPGYKNSMVDVDIAGEASATVSMGLEFHPVPLDPIEVIAEAPQPFQRTFSVGAEAAGARRAVANSRQTTYLESDVRAITAGEVLEAVTLAEPDIFRAMQRIPGVSRRDDYTAVLWTRGAPWAQTRVYFDGMPLYNPTHGGWLFSSVNPDGIGGANFHPGVRSASWGEGAAAIVDLQSRTGNLGGSQVRGELSLASARLSADGSLPGGITWMLAGRRTYVDVLTKALEYGAGLRDIHVPYDFSDLIGRVDFPLYRGAVLEASGILESDRLRGDIATIAQGNQARWGNQAGRVSLKVPLGTMLFTATTGATRFSTLVSEDEVFPSEEAIGSTLPALKNNIEHDRTAIRLDPKGNGGRLSWGVGLEFVRDSVSYDGPFSLTGEGIPGRSTDSRIPYTFNEQAKYRALWGDLRVAPLPWLQVQAGLRYETGDSIVNLDETRVAPRATVRLRPLSALSLSAGWGRSFQYTQAIGAAAGPLGPQLHLGNLWVLGGAFYPAIRADVASLGAEHWIDDTWLFSVNGYRRWASGIAEPVQEAGPLRSGASSVEARNDARGIELSARRLVGRWTGSFGYAHTRSMMLADSMRYPAAADIRHTVDVTSAYRLNPGLRVGGAFSFASGVPYTRIIIADHPRLEEPSGQRTPIYASLDLVLDYTTRYRSWDVGAYLQLLNVLGRANAVTYAGSREICSATSGVGADAFCSRLHVEDEFTAGLPRLPLFGFRIGF